MDSYKNDLLDWIDFQTDQCLEWEQVEKLVDGADLAACGIVDIEQTIRFVKVFVVGLFSFLVLFTTV